MNISIFLVQPNLIEQKRAGITLQGMGANDNARTEYSANVMNRQPP